MDGWMNGEMDGWMDGGLIIGGIDVNQGRIDEHQVKQLVWKKKRFI